MDFVVSLVVVLQSQSKAERVMQAQGHSRLGSLWKLGAQALTSPASEGHPSMFILLPSGNVVLG